MENSRIRLQRSHNLLPPHPLPTLPRTHLVKCRSTMKLPRSALAGSQPKPCGSRPCSAPANMVSLHNIERVPKTGPWNDTIRPGKRFASAEYLFPALLPQCSFVGIPCNCQIYDDHLVVRLEHQMQFKPHPRRTCMNFLVKHCRSRVLLSGDPCHLMGIEIGTFLTN